MLNNKDYNKEILNGSLYDVLAENAKEFENKNAMEYFGIHYTYGKLFRNIDAVAKSLKANGVKAGDRVGLALITTPETVALMYACSALGVATIMLDVRYKVEEIAEICKKTEAKMLFIMDWNTKALKSICDIAPALKVVRISPVESMPAFARFGRTMGYFFQGNVLRETEKMFGWKTFLRMGIDETIESEYSHNGNTEVYFSTSGTTGKRKLVTLSNQKLNLAVSQHYLDDFDLSSDRTFLSVMPIFACYGFVVSVHLPLSLGMEIIIYPIFNCKKIPQIITKKKPNYFAGVPAFYESMISSKYLKDEDLSFVLGLISGGESLSEEKEETINLFLEEHNCKTRLRQGYGMTEVAAGSFFQLDKNYTCGNVGQLFGYAEAKILDSGEICLHTPCMMTGYFGDEDATNEVLRMHEDGKLWIHTGDIGHFDELGNLTIDGRIKKMFVTENGTKIFPNMIENKIMNLDGIADCAVVPMKKESGTCVENLTIYVVARQGKANTRSLKSDINMILGKDHYNFISANDIRFCKAIPVTGFGKHDYVKLAEMAA